MSRGQLYIEREREADDADRREQRVRQRVVEEGVRGEPEPTGGPLSERLGHAEGPGPPADRMTDHPGTMTGEELLPSYASRVRWTAARTRSTDGR